MFGKVIRIFLINMLVLAMVVSCPTSFADSESYSGIENIISGNQDRLVLAIINEKGTSSYEVEVIYEIGETASESTSNSESEAKPKKINVENFDSYEYFDSGSDSGSYSTYRPKKGDNVLLSLNSGGNVYTIKNGAYKIDYADIENFNFEIPDPVDSSVYTELFALYVFVKSDGKRNDIYIENNKLYGKGSEGSEQIREEDFDNFKIQFVDEFGETSGGNQLDAASRKNVTVSYNPNSWMIALAIIVAGLAVGAVVISINMKSERKRQGD